MHFSRSIQVVGVHTAGEVTDVIVGGVLDVRGKTMYEKMMHFWTKGDDIRQLLLNEPRGRAAMCTNLVLPPCNPEADVGFIIMESEEYPPMSGANIIGTTTVLLETGMMKMQEPTTRVNIDTAAGLVPVTANCENGKCKSVAFENVPAFVFELDREIHVEGVGVVMVDVAWGGMIYCLVDAKSIGLDLTSQNGARIVEVGELIKREVMKITDYVHPENEKIRGVTVFEFTYPIQENERGKNALNTVVVSPGRLDRSPCGTGTCARLAVEYARGRLKEGELLHHQGITGTEFKAHIRGTTTVGRYSAVCPVVEGSAWITSFKQVVLDPTDPFPEGFRVGDSWVQP